MKIADSKAVTIDYVLTDDDGNEIDSSKGRTPLTYIHGMGHIIPGLEAELADKSKGDKVSVVIPPDKAYGNRNEDLTKVVPKSEFDSISNLKEGMQFQVDSEDGPIIITVNKIENDQVTIDGNHPLAGRTLHFEVEVLEVREPTEEEIKQFSQEGCDGCCGGDEDCCDTEDDGCSDPGCGHKH